MSLLGDRVAATIERVAAIYGLTREEIVSMKHRKRWSEARDTLMFELRQLRRSDGRQALSTPRIGQLVGGRDHTTVLTALRRYGNREGFEEQDWL